MLCARVVRGINSDRKRGDAGGRDLLDNFFHPEGPQKTNQYLIAAEQRHILFACEIVGTVAEDLHDHIGSGKHSSAVGNDFRALVGVERVDIARLNSSSRLYVDFETSFGQRRNHRRHQRDPPLSGVDLFRHTDDQVSLPLGFPVLGFLSPVLGFPALGAILFLRRG